MKKLVLVLLFLATAGSAFAALGDMSTVGLTGLWRFEDADWTKPTIGSNLGGEVGQAQASSAWVEMGVPGHGGYYSDGYSVRMYSVDKDMIVNPNFTANGGGNYANEYTIAFDYWQDGASSATEPYNCLLNTAWDSRAGDADLLSKWVSTGNFQIGSDATGWSTTTYNANTWHRIVMSVDNGSFFRVYVDGALILDGIAQSVDGTYGLYLDRFNMFAGGWDWSKQKWGYCATLATWDRALSSGEIADMGGWLNGSATPTALVLIPEPITMAFLALGGLLIRRK